MKLTFHGAAGTVTGSRYLLESDNRRIMVDCGMFQGLKKLRLLNWKRQPFDPRSIDRLVLTHAHIDHSGFLPRLVKLGFNKPVHCTPATQDLAKILLRDSAKIQEEDASYANKKRYSKHKPALPLYGQKEAEATLKLMRSNRYETWIDLGGDLRGRYHNAGHILGAASLEIQADLKGGQTTIVFSGDIGRYDVPLHKDPDPRSACDFLVVESTYGNRRHDATSMIEQIYEPFLEVFNRGGVVLIPAFAVGRCQMVTLMLRDLMDAGRLPEVPIHIDSPMSIDATRLYSRHLKDCNLDDDIVVDGRNRLFPHHVHFHRSVKESKELNRLGGPRVIISASGMLSGGRVLHHLGQRLPDPKNLILMAGYQAAGTRGRALLEGAKTIKMHGNQVPVRAEFRQMHGLSAHADCDELMRWIKSGPTLPKTILITHGEPEASEALAERIQKETQVRCVIPGLGDTFDFATGKLHRDD